MASKCKSSPNFCSTHFLHPVAAVERSMHPNDVLPSRNSIVSVGKVMGSIACVEEITLDAQVRLWNLHFDNTTLTPLIAEFATTTETSTLPPGCCFCRDHNSRHFLLAKHDHVPVTNRSRGPTNVLGEKQLQQHLLLVAESLDCANGKKGRPKNAIHCCLVKRVWLSELFGNAIRVPVGILAVVPDALLAEAWTTHSGGGDCLGGLTNATKERFSFCRQKKQYIWLTHHKRTIQNDIFANTRCLLRKRFLPLWACQLR